MNAMASQATHAAPAVSHVLESLTLVLVATQTAGIQFLGCCFGGIENFGLVAASVNMGAACPVATLAGNSCLTVFFGQLDVRIGSEVPDYFLVAGGAGIVAEKIRGGGSGLSGSRSDSWNPEGIGTQKACA